MGRRLSVTVGPFARCKYEGRRPDIADLTSERMVAVDGEERTKGVVHVASNVANDHQLRFEDECAPVAIDKARRVDDMAWFVEMFADELAAIEAATGHTPEVLWGVTAVDW
jgi:hypothetical protein